MDTEQSEKEADKVEKEKTEEEKKSDDSKAESEKKKKEETVKTEKKDETVSGVCFFLSEIIILFLFSMHGMLLCIELAYLMHYKFPQCIEKLYTHVTIFRYN